MAHRTLGSMVFAGMEPTTAATVISLLGDGDLPKEIRIISDLQDEPWRISRTGLLVIGMTPETDLTRVSYLIQNRTTWWEVVVCLSEVLANYEVALLAQGAAKAIRHPHEDLEGCSNQLRALLKTMQALHTDAFGLEVADLVQLFGEKRLDKTIRLMGGGTIGSIFMRGGNVIHAETIEGDLGMDAFQRLISIGGNIEVRVHKGCLTTRTTVNLPAMSALLEGSRVLDERRNQPSHTPPGPNYSLTAMDDIHDELDHDDHPAPAPQPRAPKPTIVHNNDDGDVDLSMFDEIDMGDHDATRR